jgi:hypothetical protein
MSVDLAAVTGLNWKWIVLMAAAPPIVGVLVAFPVWRTKRMILGNLAGTLVILGIALALILRESAEIDAVTRACLDAGFTCWPVPAAFTRYAIYASIGMLEVFGLFTLSLTVERRLRDRDYAPEWR